jgi:hypothetical protein
VLVLFAKTTPPLDGGAGGAPPFWIFRASFINQ